MPGALLALDCFAGGHAATTDTNAVRWWLTITDLGARLAEQPALALQPASGVRGGNFIRVAPSVPHQQCSARAERPCRRQAC